jgi:hypothetical protein
MTARFDRLSIMDGTILASMLAVLAIFFFPTMADASVQNKTSQVFEIKNFQTIKIPEIPQFQLIADLNKDAEKVEMAQSAGTLEIVPAIEPTPTPAIAEVKLAVTAKTITIANSNAPKTVPAKKTGKDRVYMHEPEIRAYICPKLGDKCNTFIAILKAENGSHECTRDNRGLNKNGSIDIGLTQINWTPNSPYTFEQLQDCKFNLDIAMKKYETRGFQPWAAYNSGRYKKHLPAVLASAKALEAAAVAASAEVAAAVSVN